MNKLNNSALTINELYNIANEVNLKVKICPLEKLPIIISNGNYIIMIHPKNEDGHFTCFKKEGDNIYYFDNFGQPPPSKIKIYGNIFYNNHQLTTINQNHCGQWCIDFLKHVQYKKGHKNHILAMDKFIKQFHIYNTYNI